MFATNTYLLKQQFSVQSAYQFRQFYLTPCVVLKALAHDFLHYTRFHS